MNMLKLIGEMRGFDDLANRRTADRPQQGLLAFPLRLPLRRGAPPRRKHVIPIAMQDRPDIPTEVAIRFIRRR
jgi:hypothetical protein